MAAHARLKNDFMEDEKYHNLMRCNQKLAQNKWFQVSYRTIAPLVKFAKITIDLLCMVDRWQVWFAIMAAIFPNITETSPCAIGNFRK